MFAQESLLNSYRCRFGVDTGVVPGGCRSGKPAQPAAQPVPFAGQPTSLAVAERDRLIYAQEWQLNTLRCRFGVDTTVVPGGCQQQDMAAGATRPLITVPPEAPSGRCSSHIASGIYNWEDGCAWSDYFTDSAYNYPLSDGEAAELLRRIWEEVDTPGKPANPPTAALVPSGTRCSTNSTIGCYIPSEHHINRLDAFLRVLLHEVAHALIADHSSVKACASRSGNAFQACVHNDLFRCVADHLYVAYAGIPTAGVCGTVGDAERPSPTTQPGPSGSDWRSWQSDDGRMFAAVETLIHSSDQGLLIARCTNGEVEVYIPAMKRLWRSSTRTVDGAYIQIPDGYYDYSEARKEHYIDEHTIWVDWGISVDRESIFASDYQTTEDLVNLLRTSEYPELHIWSEVDLGSDRSALWSFPIQGAQPHVDKVIDQCGWTEKDGNQQPAPAPNPTPQPTTDNNFSFQARCTQQSWQNSPSLEILWNAGQTNFDYETRWFELEIREQSSGRSVTVLTLVLKIHTDWDNIYNAFPGSEQTYEVRAREQIDYIANSAWSSWVSTNRCP